MGRVMVHERAKRPLLYRMYALIHELSGSLRSAQSRVRECTWIAIRAHVSSRLGSLSLSLSLAWRQEVLCTHDAKNSFRSAAAVPYELKSTAPRVYYTMSGWSKFCISNLEYARERKLLAWGTHVGTAYNRSFPVWKLSTVRVLKLMELFVLLLGPGINYKN